MSSTEATIIALVISMFTMLVSFSFSKDITNVSTKFLTYFGDDTKLELPYTIEKSDLCFLLRYSIMYFKGNPFNEKMSDTMLTPYYKNISLLLNKTLEKPFHLYAQNVEGMIPYYEYNTYFFLPQFDQALGKTMKPKDLELKMVKIYGSTNSMFMEDTNTISNLLLPPELHEPFFQKLAVTFNSHSKHICLESHNYVEHDQNLKNLHTKINLLERSLWQYRCVVLFYFIFTKFMVLLTLWSHTSNTSPWCLGKSPTIVFYN